MLHYQSCCQKILSEPYLRRVFCTISLGDLLRAEPLVAISFNLFVIVMVAQVQLPECFIHPKSELKDKAPTRYRTAYTT